MMDGSIDKLLGAVTTIVANTHPDKVRQLAGRIHQLGGATDSAHLNNWAATSQAKQNLVDLIKYWKASKVTPGEFSGMLVGASHAYQAASGQESLELVWTGPSSEMVATRKTEQALLEVIDAACEELFLTTFVAYGVSSVLEALGKAIERGVTISMLLESSDQHGGSISIDAIAAVRKTLPKAKVYYWNTKEGDYLEGKVHAKVAVADARFCFISSANLTGHAMEKNMEAGVLIRGGDVPERLHRHLKALITAAVVKEC